MSDHRRLRSLCVLAGAPYSRGLMVTATRSTPAEAVAERVTVAFR